MRMSAMNFSLKRMTLTKTLTLTLANLMALIIRNRCHVGQSVYPPRAIM